MTLRIKPPELPPASMWASSQADSSVTLQMTKNVNAAQRILHAP